jgi:hypothetical protein
MSSEEKYCHWINLDTGEIHVIPISTPIEKYHLISIYLTDLFQRKKWSYENVKSYYQ